MMGSGGVAMLGPVSQVMADLGFPVWLRVAHWINFIFLGLLIRSGIQILSSYPRLYINDHSEPGTEWAKFTRNDIPTGKLWITRDQEVEAPSWLAQPGGKNLGLGRHWHFFSIIFWMLNGVDYVVLLFATGEWRRLIPTSWSIFPAALHTFVTYLTFHVPPQSEFKPYDPLQQLAYATVVFVLGPFLMVTGAAQSPAVGTSFPWFVRLLGGKQMARSLHFLGMLAFVAFLVVHVALVVMTDFGRNMGDIVLGQDHTNQGLAVVSGLALIAATVIGYGVTSRASLVNPRRIQLALDAIVHPVLRVLANRVQPKDQGYSKSDISPTFLVNGALPHSDEFLRLQQNHFAEYRLEVKGLVEHPLNLSLITLAAMEPVEYMTRHESIQGWTSIGAWKGVPMRTIIEQCHPFPEARYAIFWSFPNDTEGNQFYESLDLSILQQPQTYLAYLMNDHDLPVPHGAPLRLRAETQLGFKMVKWLCAIEFVADYRTIRGGNGGSHEDVNYYDQSAGI